MPDLGPDRIVLRWTHYMTIDVRKSVMGPRLNGERRISMVLHSEFNPEIDYFLFYLKREKGGYRAVSADAPVVRGANGQFILKPFASTAPEIEVTRRVEEITQAAGAFCEAAD